MSESPLVETISRCVVSCGSGEIELAGVDATLFVALVHRRSASITLLQDSVWGEPVGTGTVHAAISRLRTKLRELPLSVDDPLPIRRGQSMYQVELGNPCEFDHELISKAWQMILQLKSSRDPKDQDGVWNIATQVERFMPEVGSRPIPVVSGSEQLLAGTREEIETTIELIRDSKAEAALELRREADVIAELSGRFGEDPTSNKVTSLVALARIRLGQSGQALEAVNRHVAAIEELGLTPDPATRKLAEDLRSGEFGLDVGRIGRDFVVDRSFDESQTESLSLPGSNPPKVQDLEIRVSAQPSIFEGLTHGTASHSDWELAGLWLLATYERQELYFRSEPWSIEVVQIGEESEGMRQGMIWRLGPVDQHKSWHAWFFPETGGFSSRYLATDGAGGSGYQHFAYHSPNAFVGLYLAFDSRRQGPWVRIFAEGQVLVLARLGSAAAGDLTSRLAGMDLHGAFDRIPGDVVSVLERELTSRE